MIDVCGASDIRLTRKPGEDAAMIIKSPDRKWTLRCQSDMERGLWWSAIFEAKRKGAQFFASDPMQPVFEHDFA